MPWTSSCQSGPPARSCGCGAIGPTRSPSSPGGAARGHGRHGPRRRRLRRLLNLVRTRPRSDVAPLASTTSSRARRPSPLGRPARPRLREYRFSRKAALMSTARSALGSRLEQVPQVAEVRRLAARESEVLSVESGHAAVPSWRERWVETLDWAREHRTTSYRERRRVSRRGRSQRALYWGCGAYRRAVRGRRRLLPEG